MQNYYSISSNISWKLLKDNIVAVNLDDGAYYTFNETASLVWQQVEEGKSTEEIRVLLTSEFPATDGQTVKEDVDEIIKYWLSEKLIYLKS